MKVQPGCLDVGDAVELGELLEFLGRWAACDGYLDASLRRFVGCVGYGIDELQADLSRFALLLGVCEEELLLGGDD